MIPPLGPRSFSLFLHVDFVIWVKEVIYPCDCHLLLDLYLEPEERVRKGNDHVTQEILLVYDDDGGDDDDEPPLSLW